MKTGKAIHVQNGPLEAKSQLKYFEQDLIYKIINRFWNELYGIHFP